MNSVLAWHFVGDTLRDGRPIPADGVKLIHEGALEMCVKGLHASRKLIDALSYAPGDTICRVRCGGKMYENTDKLVCTERTILWRVDAEGLLRQFARKQALSVINLWEAPQVVQDYLETGDETIRDAAWAAARAAAWAAARAAAWAAASAAASDAWDAARAAAKIAASAAANKQLTQMVMEVHRQ